MFVVIQMRRNGLDTGGFDEADHHSGGCKDRRHVREGGKVVGDFWNCRVRCYLLLAGMSEIG